MTRQSCATRKGLLAVGVGALVRSLARMDSAMTRERRGIAEGLAAALTHMRLFSSVDARVHCESRALNELLSTAWIITDVGAYSAVNTFMSGEITSASKSLATGRACKSLGEATSSTTLSSFLLGLLILNRRWGCVHGWLSICWVIRGRVIRMLNQGHLLMQLRRRGVAHARTKAV